MKDRRTAVDRYRNGPHHDLWNQHETCARQFGPDAGPTLGCLLALVRGAWGCPRIYVQAPAGGKFAPKDWCAIRPSSDSSTLPSFVGRGPTEGDALAAALLAAP